MQNLDLEYLMEANKSGDSSLHDWFNKSKASDGTKGWVQLGGKYAGKPCAKQPGQTTKPKCGSSKMKRNLNKKEEEAAFRRKNREDKNPNRSGKPINVRTEGKTFASFMSEEELLNKMASGLKKVVSQPTTISSTPTKPTPAGQVPKPPKLPAPVNQVDTNKTGQMNDVAKEVNNHTRRLDAPGNVPGATGPKLVGLPTPAASTAMKGRA